MAHTELGIGTTKWRSPTAPAYVVRRRPAKGRLILTAMALAIVLTIVFDSLATVFLGALLLIVARRYHGAVRSHD
jgi:hypothetical protein